MAGIGIVVGILVTLVAVLIPWLPTSASEEMDRIEFVFWFATVICIGIFALVASVIIYSVLTFRSPPEDESDGPSIHGHTGLEVAWTVVPAVLVVAIGVLSAVVLSQNGNAGPNPLPVKVFALQFAWRFEYPEQNGLKSGELVLPVGRSVRFEMQSADVIHSFWIPEMGQKQDLVPGITTRVVVTPKREGTFRLVCTELCGLGHATMRAPVRVLSQAKFDAWVKQQQAGAGAGDKGAATFAAAGCGGCHTFTPAGTNGKIGPSLDNVAADAKKAGEDVRAYVKESIVDPNKVIAQGYSAGVMPRSYGQSLSAEEIDALVQYLAGSTQ
ncbi:CoxB: cytochrome c oxidase, subunit II [Gaiella occulta]|uniref:Cytochrome c oxidase subunit 2 n=2 Tax=Gaiella occulta TaxID=1002870 RepID=A0A7M2Z1B5_9ACTN|nr:CoxB: cytochrome c oxidase, subunit II [Gaiella occulta]